MRVIIVGVHNKSGLKPLDSSTKSGKIIDRIELELPAISVVRSNLFNVDYLPKDKAEKDKLKDEWFRTNLPTPDDIVVLLGGDVKREFKYDVPKLIHINHPGYIIRGFGKIREDEYVINTVKKINIFRFDSC